MRNKGGAGAGGPRPPLFLIAPLDLLVFPTFSLVLHATAWRYKFLRGWRWFYHVHFAHTVWLEIIIVIIIPIRANYVHDFS